MIFALSDPNVGLAPADIDCNLIVDDDFLLTFEVNEPEGVFVDCLPGAAFFRREIALRNAVCMSDSPVEIVAGRDFR